MAFEKTRINGFDVFKSKHRFGLYAYVNTDNDEVMYIGKCSGINESMRARKHESQKGKKLQKINTWLQNNPDKWEYQVLAICVDEDWMEDMEASLIAQFKAIGECKYNIQDEIDLEKIKEK